MAKLTVTTTDGRVLRHTERHRRGSPENPVSAADLVAKFEALTGPLLAPTAGAMCQDLVNDFDNLADVRSVIDALHPAATDAR